MDRGQTNGAALIAITKRLNIELGNDSDHQAKALAVAAVSELLLQGFALVKLPDLPSSHDHHGQ